MDTALLDILACPKCRGSLVLIGRENADTEPESPAPEKASGLSCDACQVVYPVMDGIPVLLIEEAVPRQQWSAAAPQK